MLTQNHRQEELSRAYVRAIAAHAGLICSQPELDYGIDLSLRSVEQREGRYRDAGVQLDLQIKSTTRVNLRGHQVLFDLSVPAYNDLRELDVPCPRILVVFLMPDDEVQWLHQSTEELCLRQCAFWTSLKGQPPTTSSSTVRIPIPTGQVLSVEAVSAILRRIRERKDP